MRQAHSPTFGNKTANIYVKTYQFTTVCKDDFVDIKKILFNIVTNAGQRWRHAWRVSSALFGHAIRQ